MNKFLLTLSLLSCLSTSVLANDKLVNISDSGLMLIKGEYKESIKMDNMTLSFSLIFSKLSADKDMAKNKMLTVKQEVKDYFTSLNISNSQLKETYFKMTEDRRFSGKNKEYEVIGYGGVFEFEFAMSSKNKSKVESIIRYLDENIKEFSFSEVEYYISDELLKEHKGMCYNNALNVTKSKAQKALLTSGYEKSKMLRFSEDKYGLDYLKDYFYPVKSNYFEKNGYDRDGLNVDSFDKYGYDRDGYDRDNLYREEEGGLFKDKIVIKSVEISEFNLDAKIAKEINKEIPMQNISCNVYSIWEMK